VRAVERDCFIRAMYRLRHGANAATAPKKKPGYAIASSGVGPWVTPSYHRWGSWPNLFALTQRCPQMRPAGWIVSSSTMQGTGILPWVLFVLDPRRLPQASCAQKDSLKRLGLGGRQGGGLCDSTIERKHLL